MSFVMGRVTTLSGYEKGQIDGLTAAGKSNRQIVAVIKQSPKVANNYRRDPEFDQV